MNPAEDMLRSECVRLAALLVEAGEVRRALEEELHRLSCASLPAGLLHFRTTPGGGMEADIEAPWAVKALAMSFAAFLGDAPNWKSVVVGPLPSHDGDLVVTVQRASGETPHETIARRSEEIRDLEARLALADPEVYLAEHAEAVRQQSLAEGLRAAQARDAEEIARLRAGLAAARRHDRESSEIALGRIRCLSCGVLWAEHSPECSRHPYRPAGRGDPEPPPPGRASPRPDVGGKGALAAHLLELERRPSGSSAEAGGGEGA